MVLLACQTLDFSITGSLPAVSSPAPSTEMMSPAYIFSITSKFLPSLHISTNWLAIVFRLMVRSFEVRRCLGVSDGDIRTSLDARTWPRAHWTMVLVAAHDSWGKWTSAA